MIEDGEWVDDAREALDHLRGKRGALNYIDATSALGGATHVKAALARVGERILGEEREG